MQQIEASAFKQVSGCLLGHSCFEQVIRETRIGALVHPSSTNEWAERTLTYGWERPSQQDYNHCFCHDCFGSFTRFQIHPVPCHEHRSGSPGSAAAQAYAQSILLTRITRVSSACHTSLGAKRVSPISTIVLYHQPGWLRACSSIPLPGCKQMFQA